jgi:5'-3' exonuclease
MPRVIAVVDYSCVKYQLYFSGANWDEQIHGQKPPVVEYWRNVLHRKMGEIVLGIADHAQIDPATIEIVGAVDDSTKAYWRSKVYAAQQQLLIKQGREPLHFKIKKNPFIDYTYKGNRLEASSYSEFMTLCNKLMYELPHPVFKAKGLEADDIVGIFAQEINLNDKLYMVTLDQDWLLLTDI